MARLLFLLTIILMVKSAAVAQISNVANENFVIKGKVLDQKNKPVSFASIKNKNESNGITTDSLGQFFIRVRINETVVISSIGFDTSEVIIKNNKELLVSLKNNDRSLGLVTIASKNETATTKQPSKAQAQNISNALSDFTSGANITSAPAVFNHLENASSGRPGNVAKFSTNLGSGRIYSGGALPVFSPKNDTKGRQYLFDHWAAGSIINEDGTQLKNDKYLFNYDKISKAILFTENEKNAFELDSKLVSQFTFLDNDKTLLFKKFLIADKPEFLLVLTPLNGKIELLKKITAKLIKADYVSTGLTESGNNYDEFLEDNRYFINFTSENKLENLELKKKAVLKMFSSYQDKVNGFFDEHKNAQINEELLKELIALLNKL